MEQLMKRKVLLDYILLHYLIIFNYIYTIKTAQHFRR